MLSPTARTGMKTITGDVLMLIGCIFLGVLHAGAHGWVTLLVLYQWQQKISDGNPLVASPRNLIYLYQRSVTQRFPKYACRSWRRLLEFQIAKTEYE